MMKKAAAWLLALCMCSGSFAFAKEEAVQPEIDEMAEWEANIGEFTSTPANAYTPSVPKNLLATEETAHAYTVDFDASEETGGKIPYVEGEVLFSKIEDGAMLMSDDSDILADLGIKSTEEIFRTTPDFTDGEASLFSEDAEKVWYKAEISGDVDETVKALAELPAIDSAEPNFIYEITAETAAKHPIPGPHERHENWYMADGHADHKGIHVRQGWEESYERTGKDPGAGVVVAVIDTGVDYTHEDLASSMWTNINEIPGNGIDDDGNGYIDDYYGVDTTANIKTALAGNPMDNNGHGTHVAGIIAMANNDIGGVGVAYGAKIMAIKAVSLKSVLGFEEAFRNVRRAIKQGFHRI